MNTTNNSKRYDPKDPFDMINAYQGQEFYQLLKKKKDKGSKRVGVLDTMFFDEHLDFQDSLHSNSNYFVDSSHGTHVSGIIGSRNPSYRGVFPDAEIVARSVISKFFMPIYNFKISGENIKSNPLISNLAVLRGLSSMLKSNNKIAINCSFGYNDKVQKLLFEKSVITERKISSERKNRNTLLLNALKRGKDYLVVQSSGNYSYTKEFKGEFLDAYYSVHFASHRPELRDRIITVGAIEDSYNIYKHCQLGSMVDILAPGVKIKSAVSGDRNFELIEKDLRSRLTGTSMAAPFVTGTAAMIWYLYPDLTGPQIKNIILDSADIFYNKVDKKTYKKLNLYKALLYADSSSK